jgi:hypothetical protein
MTKTSLSRALLLAGIVAAAGIAQAQTSDVPTQAGEASTMTHGQPNVATTNSPFGDHPAVMGAGPVVVYETPTYVYVEPSHPALKPHLQRSDAYARGSFAETCNVPSRSGEASTMTGGQPNAATNNVITNC